MLWTPAIPFSQLEVLRASNIEGDVEDESEYDTPEQERETNPESWFFLSFANDSAFPSGAIVRAHEPATAVQRAAEIGIRFTDAGVECTAITDEELAEPIPVEMRARLLTAAKYGAKPIPSIRRTTGKPVPRPPLATGSGSVNAIRRRVALLQRTPWLST